MTTTVRFETPIDSPTMREKNLRRFLEQLPEANVSRLIEEYRLTECMDRLTAAEAEVQKQRKILAEQTGLLRKEVVSLWPEGIPGEVLAALTWTY